MKKISIVSPTFNEEGNVELLYQRINEVMAVQTLDYEIIFIDNDSTDNTVSILRGLASRDKRVKIILNATNFGHIRSPYYGLLQTNSDASVLIASDLQDPPELLGSLIEEWERGAPIVLAVKSSSDESWPWRMFRRVFYKVMSKLAQAPLVRNATGAGLFDNKVIDQLKVLEDPYPYFRGLVTELGFPVATVEFHQPLRHSGKTKNNWITLYDIAILGLTTHGGAAIRLISLFGFLVAILSFFASLVYFVAKLLFWESFELGLAPLILGVFFFGSVQVFLLGILGEYLSSIQRRIRKLPLVIEAERVNF
jgi:glycosyltransferase involved in cell wall biosynthesis